MQQKIPVPPEGSKVSEAAITVVEKLISIISPEVKVEINLLGVVTVLRRWLVVGEASAPVSYTEEELRSIRKGAADNLEKTAATLRQQGITVNILVSTGNAVDEILKTADEIKADMIAMSTYGRSGFGRFILGSVADRVLHEGNTPLLLVRETAVKK